MNVSRKIAVPAVTVIALAVAGGAFLGAEAATGSGVFHATVAPAGASSDVTSPATASPTADTPSASPDPTPAAQDTQAVTTPESGTVDPTGAGTAATTTAADTTSAPTTQAEPAFPTGGLTAPQLPPPPQVLPPAPVCRDGSPPVWMGDGWVCPMGEAAPASPTP